LNPRRTQEPETVFETFNNQHGRSSAECLQALCKHCPSERCRCVPNRRIARELRWLQRPFQRHHTAHADDAAQLCKPEVTGSIPVRSIEEDAANRAFSYSTQLRCADRCKRFCKHGALRRAERPRARAALESQLGP
jgi:hypothetical protein